MTDTTLTLGTRGSDLALYQTTTVGNLLRAAHPGLQTPHQIIHTTGDKRTDLSLSSLAKSTGLDKGIFTKELENALLANQIDAAVHSLKDMPCELESPFALAAVLERAPMEDVLISAQPYTLDTLPQGARVGTSSVRRARQLLYLRPDLNIADLRGNVPTRVKKCLGEGAFDAILLATAGVLRLGLLDLATKKITIDGATLHAHILDAEVFFPAAGQGTIAVEVRANDERTYEAVRALNHPETEARIQAEREFLRLLGAGCQTPLGVRTWITDQTLHMAVRLFSETDATAKPREASGEAALASPLTLARNVMRQFT